MRISITKSLLAGVILGALTLVSCQPETVSPQSVAPQTAPAKKKELPQEPAVKATDDEQPPKLGWPWH